VPSSGKKSVCAAELFLNVAISMILKFSCEEKRRAISLTEIAFKIKYYPWRGLPSAG
jgi:hypothetical protein